MCLEPIALVFIVFCESVVSILTESDEDAKTSLLKHKKRHKRKRQRAQDAQVLRFVN